MARACRPFFIGACAPALLPTIGSDEYNGGMTGTPAPLPALTLRRVMQTWWPLAAGWFLMTVEIPALSAIAARQPNPQISLASWGLVFSLALILASPAMMLLSASTALSRDQASYRKVLGYTWVIALGLTAIHALLAFTPLFDLIVVQLLAAPAEIIEPSRLGFAIMLPYVVGLAYRRFNYGVLIRFGHTRAVTLGAITRLVVDVVVMAALLLAGVDDGVVLVTVTFTMGILGEAVYSGFRVRPVLPELRLARPVAQLLTLRSFTVFFMPLVMTSLLQILVQPMGTAALSRMPNPLDSLAVWPVVYSLVILCTSFGMAFTEAVVVLLDEPAAVHALHTFTVRGAALVFGVLLIVAATPLADIWFTHVAALPPELSGIATWALWGAILIPSLAFFQSWYTGALVNERHTRGITESVVIALVVNGLVLWVGIIVARVPGVYVGMAGLLAGHLARTVWLWVRTRETMRTRRAAEPDTALRPARV